MKQVPYIETLNNGMKTLFINVPASTSATVQIWFKAGSSFEQADNQGIAHFLEHMFFKGTKKRPGKKLAKAVEGFGGEINAFTSFDYTSYYINTPSNKIVLSLDILLDMVSKPTFEQITIPGEREVVFEEFRRSVDSPSQFAFSRIQNKCFKGGYKHQILGTPKTIKSFSRKQLNDFRKQYYNQSNALLVVAGDLKNKKAIIKKILEFKLPKGKPAHSNKFKLNKLSQIDVHQKEVKMAQLTFLFEGSNYLEQLAPIQDVVMSILGHGESSRLYRDLVLDSNLANASAASTMYLGDKSIELMKIVFPYENMQKVMDLLFDIIIKLKRDGIEKWEANKVKNQYVASKIYEKETVESYAFSLGLGYVLTGDFLCEDKFFDKIKAVTVEQINLYFKTLFSKEMHLMFQIPKEYSVKDSESYLLKWQKKLKKEFNINKPIDRKLKTYQKSSYDSQLKIIKLKDGITLLHRHNPINPTFVFNTYLLGGLTEENEKNNGSYHLISNLLTMGHKGLPRDELKRIIDDRSASFYGFSGKNAYGLMMQGLSENFSELLKISVDAMISADFHEEELIKEKSLVSRSLLSQNEDPARQCFNKLSSMIFANHPYGQNPIGTTTSLEQITKADLLKLHGEKLKNSKLMFSYCGDRNIEDVTELLTKYIETFSARSNEVQDFKKFKSSEDKKSFIYFDREQSNVFLGVACKRLKESENTILKMLTIYLSGQSSDLFVKVRDEMGLCYAVQPVHFNALEGGYWGIYMASGHDKVSQAINAINDIVGSIKDFGLTKSAFVQLKKMIEGQNLLNVQTNEDYANIYSIPYFQGLGLDYYHKNNQKISDMTYDKFNAEIRKILSRDWFQIVVGREDYTIDKI